MTQANFLPDSLRVELDERSYDIRFYNDDIDQMARDIKPFCPEKTLIITNETIWRNHGEKLADAFEKAQIVFYVWKMQDGEKFKTLPSASDAFDYLVQNKFSRKSCVIGFGGGVVGDLAGFVAATFMRGVNFIQIPTTVVSMVDSSVGGKTGVDHPLGKNLIGAFYQPKLVAVNTPYLKTLDEYNIQGGFAEVLKYGVIRDAEFFAWLEENIDKAMALEPEAITHVVRTSCAIKADVVSKDEREDGLRAILNYGHTFGHAIESLGEYKEKQFHGQAVAVGMAIAADVAVKMDLMAEEDRDRICKLIEKANLPQHLDPLMNPEEIYERMFSDKKVSGGKIWFVIPRKIGEVELRSDIPKELVFEILKSRQG